jgi:hypothetical protein
MMARILPTNQDKGVKLGAKASELAKTLAKKGAEAPKGLEWSIKTMGNWRSKRKVVCLDRESTSC